LAGAWWLAAGAGPGTVRAADCISPEHISDRWLAACVGVAGLRMCRVRATLCPQGSSACRAAIGRTAAWLANNGMNERIELIKISITKTGRKKVE
jgi:hypothetical protein